MGSHLSLYRVQEEDFKFGNKFGNKLSKCHIDIIDRMIMLASAQALSSSVADSIECLVMSGHPQLAGANGTIRLIQIVDRPFDLLN